MLHADGLWHVVHHLPPQDLLNAALAFVQSDATLPLTSSERVQSASRAVGWTLEAVVLHHFSARHCREDEPKAYALLRCMKALADAFPDKRFHSPDQPVQAARLCLSRIVKRKRTTTSDDILRPVHTVLFPLWRVGRPHADYWCRLPSYPLCRFPGVVPAAALFGSRKVVVALVCGAGPDSLDSGCKDDEDERLLDVMLSQHTLGQKSCLECAVFGGIVDMFLQYEVDALARRPLDGDSMDEDNQADLARKHRMRKALMTAATRGDLIQLDLLMKHRSTLGICFGECAGESREACNSPLYPPCVAGQEAAVRRLIDQCSDFKGTIDFRNANPLYGACRAGHLDLVRYLLSVRKADDMAALQVRLRLGVIAACESGNTELLHFLLDHPTFRERRIVFPFEQALEAACKCKNPSAAGMLKVVLGRGDLKTITADGVFELWLPLIRNLGGALPVRELAAMLQQHGAIVPAPPTAEPFSRGCALLHEACLFLNFEMIRVLLDHGWDVNSRRSRSDPTPPIFELVTLHDKDELSIVLPAAIALLLSRGADVSLRNKHGASVLHCVCDYSVEVPEAVTLLIAAGADVNAHVPSPGRLAGTPVHVAIQRGFCQIAKILIQAGARLEFSATPPVSLHSPARFSNWELAEILRDAGADVNQQFSQPVRKYSTLNPSEYITEDKLGQTPLGLALTQAKNSTSWSLDQMHFIQKLLEAGGKVEDSFKKIPLPTLQEVDEDGEFRELIRRFCVD